MDLPLLPDLEPDIIHTNAYFTPDQRPAVYWQLNGRNGLISLVEAKARAQCLFQAAGYAESEAAVARGVLKLHQEADSKPNSKPKKGFGRQKRSPEDEHEAMAMAMGLREFIKRERSPLLEGVEVIFGARTRKALINVFWYGEPAQWEASQAIDHAIILVETAEAAESDAFFRWFLIEQIGVSVEESHSLIEEFQSFRNRRQLEDLFREGDR